MFYSITDKGLLPQDSGNVPFIQPFVGYLTREELNQHEKELGVSGEILEECMYEQTRFRLGLSLHDSYSFGVIQVVNIHNVNKECARLAFYMKQNMFLFVELKDPEGRQRKRFLSVMEKEWKSLSLEKVVFSIFDGFLMDGNAVLEETEQTIIAMESRLVDGKIDKNLNKRIFELKRQLTIQKNYYQQLSSIGDGLLENENGIFKQEEFKYFKVFTDKSQRLEKSAQMLCEDLIHVREALDAALNYSLNSIMKVFTVVTTIFLPLSLIAGWYGMNFTGMPELTWRYGYPSVIGISLLVVCGCLIFFKWRKLL